MLRFEEENWRMRILGEDADMIWKSIKNMPHITKLEFVDDGDWQYNGKHASYGEGYMCRICGVVGGKKIPLDATQSLGRIFTIALHAAQAARLELECNAAHMTHAPHNLSVRKSTSPLHSL